MPPLTSRAQTMRAVLLASATITSILGLRGSPRQPRARRRAAQASLPDHRTGSEDEQAADGSLSLF